MVTLNFIGAILSIHQRNFTMRDKKPKYNGKRNGYWFVSYQDTNYDEGEMGWRGYYINDEMFGYFEDLGPYNVVLNKEYYAR